MGDSAVFFFLTNVLLFGLIFWLLTFGAEYFFKKNKYKMSAQFYECGFKAMSDLQIQVNINFSMLCVFLILYDVEFLLLFPFLFNISFVSIFEFIIFIVFIYLIILSFIFDLQYNTFNWQY